MNGTISVSTSQRLRERVDQLAAKLGCEPGDVLRDALLRFIATEEVRLGIEAPREGEGEGAGGNAEGDAGGGPESGKPQNGGGESKKAERGESGESGTGEGNGRSGA